MLEYMISNVICSLWGCPYIKCCLDLQGVSEGFLLVLCRRVMEKNESCVGKFTATYSKFWKIGLWTFAGVHGHLWLASGTCLVTLWENSKLVRLLVKDQAQQVISLPWISPIWVVSKIMLIFLWLPDWDQLIGSILLGPGKYGYFNFKGPFYHNNTSPPPIIQCKDLLQCNLPNTKTHFWKEPYSSKSSMWRKCCRGRVMHYRMTKPWTPPAWLCSNTCLSVKVNNQRTKYRRRQSNPPSNLVPQV